MKRLFVLTISMLLLTACNSWRIDVGNFHMSGGDPVQTSTETPNYMPGHMEIPPTVVPVADNGRPSPDAGINLADYVRFTGVPKEAKAYRWADGFYNENICTLPWGLDFCGDPGVEETHNPEDKNPSAQFISPDSQESLESATGEKDVPQDGYMRVTGAYYKAVFANGMSFTALENDDTEVILYVRGLNSTGPGNFNVKTVFSGYNPGATTVTVYDIAKGANGFMGEKGIRKTVANSHLRNCGDGCRDTLLVFLDLDNGGWSAFFSEAGGDLKFAGSNVIPPDGVR